ncbi:MAG: metalloregulator ArsR/SmtB family transcription factor, partial [Actinobacteria bacterium]|nr:metalloregulator ArsR/SmtB family transcription factor [Actinomycetota bacterium]
MNDSDSFENCSINVIHEDIIKKVSNLMPDDKKLYELSELFKVLGDTTRVKIIYALFESEMCVCDISALFNMNQSAISHQLRTLKQARLVKFRRDGKVVYYSLDDEHVKLLFDYGLIHVKEK